jgi:class 3 adenylate cyclase
MDFGHRVGIDYAGSIVNLAARLQGLARPEGFVAQLGFSESLFRKLATEGEGRIESIPSPKGLGQDRLDVFASKEVILPAEPSPEPSN